MTGATPPRCSLSKVIDPALRNRGSPRQAARLLAQDGDFREAMETVFKEPAAGRFTPPMLWDTAAQVRRLESRVNELGGRVRHLEEG